MPAGYEKIRDSLIAQGKSEEDAKTLAAKIWNKHHKGDEAVGRHYDEKHEMSRNAHPYGVILLGVPNEFFQGGEAAAGAAEKRLLRRMSQLGVVEKTDNAGAGQKLADAILSTGTQKRVPLPAPIPTHPVNPNAALASEPENPGVESYLDWLRKKYNPSGPTG